uniref:G protein-coupled receptor 149 n=1 Tax=Callorhinchus milii TaxID=7868 RepID=A0A4W3H5E1_CALMI
MCVNCSRNHSSGWSPGSGEPQPELSPGQSPGHPVLFSLTLSLCLLTLPGSLYSLLRLLRAPRTCLTVLVASISLDDALSLVPCSMFLAMQWDRRGLPASLCQASALLYALQALANVLKSTLLLLYHQGVWAWAGWHWAPKLVLLSWVASLALSLLPLCGWGSFVPTPWGCLVNPQSSYTLLLVSVYALCLCALVLCSVPLTYRLLCSEEQERHLYPAYYRVSESVSLAAGPSTSEDPVEKTLKSLQGGGQAGSLSQLADTGVSGRPHSPEASVSPTNKVSFTQKRFSLILAVSKIVLWLPMMVMHHVTRLQSVSIDSLSFMLTLLATAVTPIFVLSEHWLQLPCGCIINCKRSVYTVASHPTRAKRRGFEFNLSFQQGYGIYKISQANSCNSEGCKTLSHHNLNAYLPEASKAPEDTRQYQGNAKIEISTSSPQAERAQARESVSQATEEKLPEQPGTAPPPSPQPRPAQEGDRKLELTDWEWCRSNSERTPRQRADGLSIPLCAFQGTVSLHAPTGKTLSLSTYEMSGKGQKIVPVSKKIEVYRSKSVGHEPSGTEASDFADTKVKIHLEVLEICDNEEALDTVSIVSNISQSSTHTRSPSLRYSRRENRFVSVDLGESASYSILIPTNNSSGDIISIPDTVEAHRQNSKRQHGDKSGYREEIQVLNEAYRQREEGSQQS